MPVLKRGDGTIRLADGSCPHFTNKKGVIAFECTLPDEPGAPAHSRFVIDRGSEHFLGGRRFSSEAISLKNWKSNMRWLPARCLHSVRLAKALVFGC